MYGNLSKYMKLFPKGDVMLHDRGLCLLGRGDEEERGEDGEADE